MWIGYSDEEEEGKWISHNNKDPVSTHWGVAYKEPNGGRGSNCAVLVFRGDWDDQPCDSPTNPGMMHPFACQIPNCSI